LELILLKCTAYAKKFRKCEHLQSLYELRENYALPDKITQFVHETVESKIGNKTAVNIEI